jgi:hypothetical protein
MNEMPVVVPLAPIIIKGVVGVSATVIGVIIALFW